MKAPLCLSAPTTQIFFNPLYCQHFRNNACCICALCYSPSASLLDMPNGYPSSFFDSLVSVRALQLCLSVFSSVTQPWEVKSLSWFRSQSQKNVKRQRKSQKYLRKCDQRPPLAACANLLHNNNVDVLTMNVTFLWLYLMTKAVPQY